MKKAVLVLITFALVIAAAGCGFWLVHSFIDSKERQEARETGADKFILENTIDLPLSDRGNEDGSRMPSIAALAGEVSA